MARVAIPILELRPDVGAVADEVTGWATGAAASGYEWAWQPNDLCLITNITGTTPGFTILRPPNRYGRGADFAATFVIQYTVRLFFPRLADGWVVGGLIQIDTASNDLRFVVLRPKPTLPAS